MTVPIEEIATELERQIADYTRDGWQIVSRTTTSAQLRRPKRWSMLGSFVFILLPVLGGFLFDACFYGIALGGFALLLLGYLISKDELKYISEKDIANRLIARRMSPP